MDEELLLVGVAVCGCVPRYVAGRLFFVPLFGIGVGVAALPCVGVAVVVGIDIGLLFQ